MVTVLHSGHGLYGSGSHALQHASIVMILASYMQVDILRPSNILRVFQLVVFIKGDYGRTVIMNSCCTHLIRLVSKLHISKIFLTGCSIGVYCACDKYPHCHLNLFPVMRSCMFPQK